MGFFGRLFGGSKGQAMEGEGTEEGTDMPGETHAPEMTDGEEAAMPEEEAAPQE